MATADDTAHARPKLHHRAKSHAPTDTPVHTPTLSDVKLAARAIVRVLAQMSSRLKDVSGAANDVSVTKASQM